MDQAYFARQMGRLSETFTPTHYKDERVRLIWREVQHFSDDWMRRTIDHFIGTCRYAPLLAEFREEMSKEREIQHHVDKKKQTAETTTTSLYSFEDIQTICAEIRRRMKGNMNDADFESFNKMIAPQTKIQCEKCLDSRLYFDDIIHGWVLCTHFR